MRYELLRHKLAYLVLALGLLAFVVAFFAVWPNRIWQRLLIVALMIFYTGWGGITHVHADHLSRKIIMEYFGMSLLVGVMLLLMTL